MKNKIWEKRFFEERKVRSRLQEQLREERQKVYKLQNSIIHLNLEIKTYRHDLEQHGHVFTGGE